MSWNWSKANKLIDVGKYNYNKRKIKMKILISISLIIMFSTYSSAKEMDQKAVLVTGASTGIGKKITEVLARKGYFVYAGARKEKDLKTLNMIKNVQSVKLDVTKQDEIDAAVRLVTEAGRGLYAVVNNAGVGMSAPLIEANESDLNFIFNVNIYGPYRITKAFAPLVIESKGRISTIGSIAGTLTVPFLGPYSMTKHAMEAYSDALAMEMAKFDVQVSVVEPGNYNSAISKSNLKRLKAKNGNYENSLYKDDYEKQLAGDGNRDQHKEPDEVADAVVHALFSEKPKHRYMVVPNKKEATWTITQSMRKMIQQNYDQPHAFNREELITIMDSMLKEVKK